MDIRKDLTAALVDNELHDEVLKNQLVSQIETDSDLRYDYMVQNLVKTLIKDKVSYQAIPEKVKSKVLRKIQPKEVRVKSSSTFFAGFFSRPALSFATAILVILAALLILINRPEVSEPKDFALEQLGDDNMFVQAKNNFRSILEGKLAPQLVSSDPSEVKNFFVSSGVKYSTLVPYMTKWDLLGAVVSEDRGEKFAHHVYSNPEGEIVYLFQVEESYLQTHEIIKLTDDLLSYLDEGNCYTTLTDDYSTLMAKSGNNIYAVVSNASLEDISQSFCALN
ncbi:MAG TPA: hypothetical protein VK870_03480 [Ignavibacteriaceae bacterium]|nr:hypothetical protein [Ignavibacteriaceae bacterium]